MSPDQWMTIPFLLLSVYCLILIAFYDFETQNIPDVFIMILLLSALLFQAVISTQGDALTMRDAFGGAAIPLLFFGTLWLLGREQWIGSGDILLGVAIGLLLGIERSIMAIFLAYIMGASVAVFLLLQGHVRRGSTMAFGPYLSAGALIALFVGADFLREYQILFFGL